MDIAGPTLLLKQIIVATMTVPILAFGVIGDLADAALIAGVFTLLNTWLNARLHKKLDRVKAEAKVSAKALVELAEEKKKEAT